MFLLRLKFGKVLIIELSFNFEFVGKFTLVKIELQTMGVIT